LELLKFVGNTTWSISNKIWWNSAE